MEDYCHSFEHTVELQVIFLQHMLGPDVRILPILCGSYARSLYQGGKPEDDDRVKRFLEALGEMREREGDRLFWILGVDMAHMGVRYQDDFEAHGRRRRHERSGRARRAAHRAHQRNCDAGGFWDLVRENHDDLKWCGSSPFYTFLKTAPQVARRTAALRAVEHRRQERGQLRRNGISEVARASQSSPALRRR